MEPLPVPERVSGDLRGGMLQVTKVGPSLPVDLVDPAPSGREHRRGVVRRLVRVVIVVAVASAVGSQSGTLLGAGRRLGRVSLGWVVAAGAAEVVSYLTAAELQRHLLAAAGVRMSRRFLVALTLAGSAVAAVLPAGGVVATGYTYRCLAGRVGRPMTVWVLVSSGVVSTAALAALGLAGAQAGGGGLLGSSSGRHGAVLIAAGAIGGVVLLAWASRRRSRLERIGALLRRASGWGRRPLRPASSARLGPGRLFPPAWGDPVTMRTVGWLGAFAVGLANWVADGAVLALSFVA